jgi:hypothetical protein
VLVITGYVGLLHWVHPARLRRAMSYLQLVAAMSFYACTTWPRAPSSRRSSRARVRGLPWLWTIPSTWYAALIAVAPAARRRGVDRVGRGAAAVAACVPLAAGRLSLDYARRVGEAARSGSRRAGAAWRGCPGLAAGKAAPSRSWCARNSGSISGSAWACSASCR